MTVAFICDFWSGDMDIYETACLPFPNNQMAIEFSQFVEGFPRPSADEILRKYPHLADVWVIQPHTLCNSAYDENVEQKPAHFDRIIGVWEADGSYAKWKNGEE